MSSSFLPATAAVRRYLAVVLAILLAASMLAIATAVPARAAPTSVVLYGITYTVYDDAPGATVTDYDRTAGPVVDIADTVTVGDTDYTVTAIGGHAFYGRNLTSVSLPDGLVTIGSWAFAHNQLTSLVLPDGLTSIDYGAFTYNWLAAVDFPDSLVTIGDEAFTYNQLTSVELLNGVVKVGSSSFANNRLTSVSLPDSLVTIGSWAFLDNQLAEVTLPVGLTDIGHAAFSGNQLTTVAFPDSLLYINDYAFWDNQLSSVAFGEGLEYIGGYGFANNQLTSVEIPAGVTDLGWGVFDGNEALTWVQFTGPAPTSIAGADSGYPSLGAAVGLTVTFPALYLAQSPQEGYTTPEWLGYTAYATGHAVFFNTGGGSDIDPVDLGDNDSLVLPSVPVREGYTFTGWYTTPELDALFDSETPITGNLTLYAGWKRSALEGLNSVGGSLGSLASSGAGA